MKKVLHIGQMKSGTTYIQNILCNNRKELSESGWMYPGDTLNQQHACYGICGNDIFWVKEGERYQARAAKLIDDIYTKKKNIIVSSEALSSLNESGIERFLEKIGGADEVVVTIRSLYKTLPSAWQQSIKGGGGKSIYDFFSQLALQRPERLGFWKTYSFGMTVKLWSKFLPVKAIVVPDKPVSKNKLWDDFSDFAGLPSLSNIEIGGEHSNISLNYEAAEILRSINRNIRKWKPNANKKYLENFRSYYLNKFVFPVSDVKRGIKIKIPPEFIDDLATWSEPEVELLQKHAYSISGNVSCLELNEDGCLDPKLPKPTKILAEIGFQIVSLYDRESLLEVH
ncbi:hypothetical protein IEI94_10255 [Halomonas sp. ML-15]|uniref:hypothetical protein n=1 Tax=Halomonas sp. ML-15 TaxID=2773305 RepID=UPI0017470D35|nr:hypothetical protein [Halomonas sp. ML-15]MBD3896231.1 hypothetical protein [Halomonas sp. ML-15]